MAGRDGGRPSRGVQDPAEAPGNHLCAFAADEEGSVVTAGPLVEVARQLLQAAFSPNFPRPTYSALMNSGSGDSATSGGDGGSWRWVEEGKKKSTLPRQWLDAFLCHVDATLGGGCKVVHFGAHMGLHMHECILLPCHNALPYFHMTYPSHIDTCMPHAITPCGMRSISVTCWVCVSGHTMIVSWSPQPTHHLPRPRRL